WRQNTSTPALTNSSRSTRGTTRTTAYSNELSAGTHRLLDEQRRRREPAGEEAPIPGAALRRGGLAVRRHHTRVRHLVDRRRQARLGELRAQAPVRLRDAARPRQQDVVAD